MIAWTMKKRGILLALGSLSLVLGAALYWMRLYIDSFPVPPFVQNNLADGLWAFSMIIFINLIWENWSLSKNIWTLVAILAGPFWELMQQIGWVRGQYDVKDIAAYLIFSLIAVLLAKMVNR
jgi:hypothetical protein